MSSVVNVDVINVCMVTEVENMQSDSSRGDTELNLLRKQMADEKMKKEQVGHLLLNCAVVLLHLSFCLSVA